jgi:hypothetical protein
LQHIEDGRDAEELMVVEQQKSDPFHRG